MLVMTFFWYFIDKNFNYKKYYCDGCHDMSMKAVRIIYFKRNTYKIYFRYMNKYGAISIMHNSNLIDKNGVLFYATFSIYKNE